MPQLRPQDKDAHPEMTIPMGATVVETVPEEDQFDADEYVKQLIARMGGAPQPSAPAAAAPSAPTPAKPAAAPKVARATRAEEIGLESSIEIDPRRLRTSRETNVDLERLREAANLNSTSDLHRSDCQGLIRRAYMDLFQAVACIALTGLLISMSRGFYSVAYLASVMLLSVAGLSTYRFASSTSILWLKLRVSGASGDKPDAVPVLPPLPASPTATSETG